jgi:hypothetical protein
MLSTQDWQHFGSFSVYLGVPLYENNMSSLSKNWITESHIDFEYKKYMVLAYLQTISEHFTEQRLYPSLSDLIEHYRNLKELKENKTSLYNSFKVRAQDIDLEHFKIIYEKIVSDEPLMRELESIIDFSLPQFKQQLEEGKKIYDFIEQHLLFYPIGIVPINKDFGYMMLKTPASSETKIYEYNVSIFENPNERYRGLHMAYITSYEKNILNTFESIKSDLLQYNKKLPNPATFVIETDLAIPFDETFLPIAKRTLLKGIAGTA